MFTVNSRRRAISCDDGRTWKNDVAADDAAPIRCFSNGNDCDHNVGSSTALTASDGVLLHATGWGTPGAIYRSTDGVAWQQVFAGDTTVSGIMAGPTRFITGSRSARRSDDRGLTWPTHGEIPLSSGGMTIWNVRSSAYGGGTFLVIGSDGTPDMQISRDNGATWQRPTLTGGSISSCSGRIAFGNNVFVVAGSSGSTASFCRSSDQGRTWTRTTVANAYHPHGGLAQHGVPVG